MWLQWRVIVIDMAIVVDLIGQIGSDVVGFYRERTMVGLGAQWLELERQNSGE